MSNRGIVIFGGFIFLVAIVFILSVDSSGEKINNSSSFSQTIKDGSRGRFSSDRRDVSSVRADRSRPKSINLDEARLRFGAKLEEIEGQSGRDLRLFETTLSDIEGYPEPFKGTLVEALFDRYSTVALEGTHLNDSDSVSSFFKHYDAIIQILGNTKYKDGEEFKRGFLNTILSDLNSVPDYSGIDSFIAAVDAADFLSREDLYVGAYVAKISGEDSKPDLENIPISGDPFLDQKLHIGLFETYAVIDRKNALSFFLSNQFAGKHDSEVISRTAASFAVRDWEGFSDFISSYGSSEKTSFLVRRALSREEIQKSPEKVRFLTEFLN
jgi:hypothetical protein